MSVKSSPRPGATGIFNKAALDYFAARGIDPETAESAGVGFRFGELTFRFHRPDGTSYVRIRDLVNDHRRGPKGQSLELWWPAGRSGGAVLLAEGESDALAALTALRSTDGLPPTLDGLTVAAIPGTGMPKSRAAAELRAEGVEVVYTVFDADTAGRKATKAMVEPLAEVGIEMIEVNLPDGLDLADLLAAADNPTGALAELIAEADAARDEATDVVQDDAAEVEPLPNDAVAAMLGGVVDTLDRFVVLPGEHERVALTLFVAHTWAIEGAHATPYMLVVSPEKRSGKSRLLQVLGMLVEKPWGVIGASEAAMFRKIAKHRPTMLLDEIDAIFGTHSERTEPLRAILNAGNRPGATVARCVGENQDVEDFPIFCAKVLAGIDSGHRIPDTIRDRAVTISMQRRTGAEPVEPLRHRDADAEAEPIRKALERWAVGAVDPLRDAYPDLPADLDDRAAEAWEPLLAIADMAEGTWPERARRAAVALSGDGDRDEVTTGTLLLGAIREAFGVAEKMATSDLLAAINADEQLPFGGWRDGKGLDSRGLARLLKPYGVRPRTVELPDGRSLKGYLKEMFSEPWSRWLPTRTEPSEASEASEAAGPVNEKPHEQADLTDLTDLTAISGNGGPSDATPEDEAEIERIAAKMGGAS
jgi:hypothetical protein